MFKSMSHFSLMGWNLICCYFVYRWPASFVKRLFFIHSLLLHLYQKSTMYTCRSVSEFSALFHQAMGHPLPLPHHWYYCSFIVVKSGNVIPPNLAYFFRIVFTILVLFPFHVNSRISLSVSAKNTAVILCFFEQN